MPLTLDSNAQDRLENRVRGVVWLVQLDFGTGTVYYSNSPVNFTIDGHSYLGANTLVGISTLSESEANSAEKITLTYSVVNQAMLASVLANVENYRGKAVRLYLQLTDDRFVPDGAPILRWTGYMDKVQVSRNASDKSGGTSTGKIELICSRAGMARARNYQGRRLVDSQRKKDYPTDRGLEYLQQLIEQPATWLSKRFQEI